MLQLRQKVLAKAPSTRDSSRKSRNVRPESEMRGKTDINGFDYHDGNQAPAQGTSSRLPSGPTIASIVVVGHAL
jgi:hypothetical protein